MNRENTIKKCIVNISESVHSLRKRRDEDEENFQIQRELRNKQNRLRLMQNELNVEEVIRDRSLKVCFIENLYFETFQFHFLQIFHERCRAFYRP